MSTPPDVDRGPPSRRRGAAPPKKGSRIWKWACGGCTVFCLLGCALLVVAILAGVNWIDGKLASHPVFAKHPKGGVSSVTYSPDGGRIATASADGTIVIWNAETAEKIASFDVMDRFRSRLTFSPDGTRLVIDGAIWDAAGGKKLITFANIPPRRLSPTAPMVLAW